MLTSSHLFITLVNGLLLTRIEHNCASSSLASCKDVIIYTNNNAVHGRVMDAKRTHGGGELMYLVVFDGGQEYVTEREMIQGFALYDAHIRMTTTNNTTT